MAEQQWYLSETGQNIWRCEKKWLDDCLPSLFGYHLMTMSVCPSLPLADASTIHHCFTLSSVEQTADASAYCHLHQLPLDSESIDVAVLHHVLDCSEDPHQLLRDTARALIPYGHVLIMGFQRCSAIGLQQVIQKYVHKNSWLVENSFIGMNRLHDWLKLLNFEVLQSQCFVYVPPQCGERVHHYLQGIERFAQKMQLPFGSVYCVLARKTVAGVRPLLTKEKSRLNNPLAVFSPQPAVPVVHSQPAIHPSISHGEIQ